MYSGPSASRGKNNKKAKGDGAQTGEKDAAAGRANKRQVQKDTRAQRKGGGMKRGGLYEVEEVGGMYGASGDAEIADVPRRKPDAESDESSSESSSEEAPSQPRYEPPPRAAGAPCVRGPSASPEEDDELAEIEEELRQQLHDWATDPGMPLDEQKRQVRQLLAQWHPDKNAHIASQAQRIFQFIQAEVNRLVSQYSVAAQTASRKEAEYKERKAQRAAEKSATAAALKASRAEKQQRKGVESEDSKKQPAPDTATGEEFSLVIGHGPATTVHLRPWPRSHLTLTQSPLDSRTGEILLFGGEAYDGRELTFYSDLYRLNLHGVDVEKPLPWEKLYSSVPMIPGPEARSAHQAVVWDKFLYVFGGEWSSRDQKRFRQFNDLWRFDVSSGPGSRWECVEASGTAPTARSGHRMAMSSTGHALVFGGFSEDRRRRATYHDDIHVLQLPKEGSLDGHAWHAAAPSADRRTRPSGRAGGLVWTDQTTAYAFGGVRPKGKGSEHLEVLDDLWRLKIDSSLCLRWERLEPRGEGPGRRSGICQCAASRSTPSRRIFFGGVTDVKASQTGKAASQQSKKSAGSEVSLFHNDVFLLDCGDASSASGEQTWTRLWPAPGTSPQPALVLPEQLSADLLRKGGGIDACALALVGDATAAAAPPVAGKGANAPRGRIAAVSVVQDGALWIFGGVCEAGPRQEVTLDDFWKLELNLDQAGSDAKWENVLPLSDRATVWFDDSDSSSDEEEDEVDQRSTARGGGQNTTALAVPHAGPGGGVLSKKAQKEEAKRARMEVKRERQQEKCEEDEQA
eukprot:TRINITY_DN26364_c1_g1_i2.p1 TRINITY_DN26364_c1_g1~~TRINITY_DN26364_c1_g1_i2.p1  ORF type:complete len:798 (+),score=123.49 TRINITY_DN26364_c1_g1_i2:44-2437(+)